MKFSFTPLEGVNLDFLDPILSLVLDFEAQFSSNHIVQFLCIYVPFVCKHYDILFSLFMFYGSFGIFTGTFGRFFKDLSSFMGSLGQSSENIWGDCGGLLGIFWRTFGQIC